MKILLFDIDGTLINTGGAGGAALLEAFREEFGVTQPAEVPFSGRTDRGIGSDLFRRHEIEDSHENWTRLCAAYLERLPIHLPRRQGRVLAGVDELLQRLSQVETTLLGLLTGNVQEGARIKLSHFALFDYFAFGGYGDRHADRDSVARDALQAAHLQLNGRGPGCDVWVIGDTPLDVRCARAIDAKIVAVATGLHPADELAAEAPDHLLNDLSETDRILELIA